MRAGRPKHREMSGQQRFEANARSYANVYQRRGKLAPMPCERCGSQGAEKYHEDYAKPLQVHWLCRRCHLDLHRSRLDVVE
jgi:NAD-dependent SIR2 family protein deacetylase